eukprot:TRINITY_DN59547_c0_g1_i1.p2 TRINITY_DN59547_c0_g1~~TRINITY_DN59547_c0_g1_i1.p2  ORF type:complete len:113 (-),score=0.48 TRINITY_DN59547_c0_g1_i1:335-673(-)
MHNDIEKGSIQVEHILQCSMSKQVRAAGQMEASPTCVQWDKRVEVFSWFWQELYHEVIICPRTTPIQPTMTEAGSEGFHITKHFIKLGFMFLPGGHRQYWCRRWSTKWYVFT